MKQIEIYTSPHCGFCHAAKRLLNAKGLSFLEVDIFDQPERRGEMLSRANGRHTVPQVFVGDVHVGGYDDLSALDRVGKFDILLQY